MRNVIVNISHNLTAGMLTVNIADTLAAAMFRERLVAHKLPGRAANP